jgi:hypothetical protein
VALWQVNLESSVEEEDGGEEKKEAGAGGPRQKVIETTTVMRSFCMEHQVTGGHSVAALDAQPLYAAPTHWCALSMASDNRAIPALESPISQAVSLELARSQAI